MRIKAPLTGFFIGRFPLKMSSKRKALDFVCTVFPFGVYYLHAVLVKDEKELWKDCNLFNNIAANLQVFLFDSKSAGPSWYELLQFEKQKQFSGMMKKSTKRWKSTHINYWGICVSHSQQQQ